MEFQNDVEFDLLELYYYLRRKVVIIVTSIVLLTALGFGYASLILDPQYTASTRMFVLNRSNEANVMVSDYQVSSYVLSDYKVLITGRNVTAEVVEKLNLPISPNALVSKIKVSSPANTRVLQIDVDYEDAEMAAEIANCVREVSARQILDIMDVDAVKLVYEAQVPTGPSSPNVSLYTFLGAVLGFILSVGGLTVKFLMDDTIRTEEDAERYLGLGTLGVIPLSGQLNSGNRKHSGRKGFTLRK